MNILLNKNVYFMKFKIRDYEKGHQMIFSLYFQFISGPAFVKYVQHTHKHRFTHIRNKIQFYYLWPQASFPTVFLSSCSVLISVVFKPIFLHSLVVLFSMFSFIFLTQMLFILQGQAPI